MLINQQTILIIVLILSFVLLMSVVLLYLQLIKLKKHYSNLIGKVGQKDLLRTFDHLVTLQDRFVKNIDKQNIVIEDLKIKMRKHLQHLQFKRFNPFSDTGGNQSFTLGLLNDEKDGIVLTALHSRDTTRIYAKKIIRGIADEELSVEEKFVVAKHKSTGDNS